MKLDIFNIDEFVKANNCPEVTNPVFWNFDGTPTTDGLFSYELFGVSDDDRKNIFGYIDLKGNFIHPLVYGMLAKKTGSIGKVATCQKYAVVADKRIKIVEKDFEGAETGITFLYNHFDEINWMSEIDDDNESISKDTRFRFLKSLKKEEFFIRKWLVIPPFYRAESSENRSMGDVINKLYKELISRTSSLSLGYSFEIFGDEVRARIQQTLLDTYTATMAPLSGKHLMTQGTGSYTTAGTGKNSMIRKHLIGKNVDWGSSSVITSPANSDANLISKKPVPYGYGGFPMATLISLFHPFYVQYITDIFERIQGVIEDAFGTNIKKLDTSQFTSKAVEKLLKSFVTSPGQRFEDIKFELITKDNKRKRIRIPLREYKTKDDAASGKNYIERPMNITDIIFSASKHITQDKHILVTRFPIANAQNIYPSKIKVLSTSKTRSIYISLRKFCW